MTTKITASKLYDYIVCPHRVWRDAHGPQDEKLDEVNSFVQLLWEEGLDHEKKIVEELGLAVDIVEEGSYEERFAAAMQAIKDERPMIYQGVLMHDNLLGIPDLLKRLPNGLYVAIDIKSGKAFEGGDESEDGKPKKHYAVQLCLYADLLKKLGLGENDKGIIIGADGTESEYSFFEPMSKRIKKTWWELYEETKNKVKSLLKNEVQNSPAEAGICKMCPWCKSCKKWVDETEDLTGIFYVGRNVRDTINRDLQIYKMSDICSLDVDSALEGKKGNKEFLKRIGEKTLDRIVKRAKVICEIKKPILYREVNFPQVQYELYFDIEDDPMNSGFVYLHGIYEKTADAVRFVSFTATDVTPEDEKRAWSEFWEYIYSLPEDDFAVYYYSQHEKTMYKKLREKYPDVISEEDLNAFFDNPNVIDLYSVIYKNSDWPSSSYSIKALACYLGFEWRDENPSGASSIEWFRSYIKTRDESILNRILEYNEDDCIAMLVVKEGIERIK